MEAEQRPETLSLELPVSSNDPTDDMAAKESPCTTVTVNQSWQIGGIPEEKQYFALDVRSPL